MSHGPADAAGAVGTDDVAEEDRTLTMPRVTQDEQRSVPVAPAEVPETDWTDDDLTIVTGGSGGQFASGLAAGLAAVPYLRAAVRRRARFCLVCALVGLLLGFGAFKARPPAAKAQTEVYVSQAPGVEPQDAVLTDVALLQSQSLAELVRHQLHLIENVNKFMASYSVAQVTDRVLELVASAPTSSEAVQRANLIASVYLHYRASIVQTQRQATIEKLNAQNDLVQQQIADLQIRIDKEDGEPSSLSRTTTLASLKSQLNTETFNLTGMEQAASTYEVQSEVNNAQEDSGSYELYPAAALPPSKYKKADTYAVGGLLAGLMFGIAFVAGAALMTDRLRRRDDVSVAVGAPVRLSVSRLRLGRAGRRGRLGLTRALEIAGGIDVQRIAAQLRSAVPDRAGGAPALAVIAIDDPYAAVLPVLALALSCARAGGQVIIADLTADASVGRLLGFAEIGVRMVTVDGEQIALCVPDPGDLVPIGPLTPTTGSAADLARSAAASRGGGRARGSRIVVNQLSAVQSTAGFQLASAYQSADLLLTVVTLDPALGAEHLPTWATDAVVMVTVGQSTSTKIHSISEMTRLAGTEVSGAILIGADKADESLGAVPAPLVADASTIAADLDEMPVPADAGLDGSRADDRRR